MTESGTTTADHSTFRSYASRRSLLDHHIPSSELELEIMHKQDKDNMPVMAEREFGLPTLGPVISTSATSGQYQPSASAPVSPADRFDYSKPTPLVIPTDQYDGRIPSHRGPPRSALPDFLPPSKPAEPVAESQVNSPAPFGAYAQPQPTHNGTESTHTEAQPKAGPSGPPKYLLSTHMRDHPDDTVRDAIKERFPLPNPLIRLFKRFRVKHSVIEGMTKEEMDHWESQRETLMQKAGWKMEGTEGPGTEVTELYWKVSLGHDLMLMTDVLVFDAYS
jgi:hypothetical protein